jgi:hypothetical protein
MNRPLRLLTGVAALALLAPLTLAQIFTPQTAVLEGDAVAGVGLVTSIDNLAVNNLGEWLCEADTDNADTNADGVVLKNGVLLLRENQALPLPVGALLDTFDTINIDLSGNSCWNFFLDGTAGTNDDSGVYFNTNLLIQESNISTAPQFSAGTPYIGFFEVKLADNNLAIVMASVDDPAIASTVDRAIVGLGIDNTGNLVSETVLAKEGDVLPGQTEAVTDFDTGPHNFALNDGGTVMFVADLTGDTTVNTVIYVGSGIAAQKGFPAPIAGRNWSSLASTEVDLNNANGWVLSASMDGDTATNLLVEKTGSKLVQEGDSLSGMNGFKLTSFGSGPVWIGDNGYTLWYGDWDDPDLNIDTGLFVNGHLIVQEGVTTIGGLAIDNLRGIQDGYALSDDGRWVAFEGELVGGIQGLFLIDLGGAWVNLDGGLSQIDPVSGEPGETISLLGTGPLTPGSPVGMHLANAPAGAFPALVVGLNALNAPFKGGTLVPDLDLLIYPGVVPLDGALSLTGVWPNGIPSGFTFWVQYWMADQQGPVGFVASNAVAGTTP